MYFIQCKTETSIKNVEFTSTLINLELCVAFSKSNDFDYPAISFMFADKTFSNWYFNTKEERNIEYDRILGSVSV